MLNQFLIWLNRMANAIGALVLAPVGWLPGWLSATLIGIVSGVLMLIVFKYTSNQNGIRKTRDNIKANTLALSLFKDNLWVSLRCQARLLAGALMLLVHSIVPMLVLTIPMILILGQMALWYQARPVQVGEEIVATVQLSDDGVDSMDRIELVDHEGMYVVSGPVRVPSKNMVCWNLKTKMDGTHLLSFNVGGDNFEKELVAGNQFMPTSIKRPGRNFGDLLLHPREEPFAQSSTVQSIELTYPERDSFTSGTNNFVIYWFIVSMIAAFAVKPFFDVNI